MTLLVQYPNEVAAATGVILSVVLLAIGIPAYYALALPALLYLLWCIFLLIRQGRRLVRAEFDVQRIKVARGQTSAAKLRRMFDKERANG